MAAASDFDNYRQVDFARALGVSRPTVNKYLSKGLPVLDDPDGRIPLERGLNWILARQDVRVGDDVTKRAKLLLANYRHQKDKAARESPREAARQAVPPLEDSVSGIGSPSAGTAYTQLKIKGLRIQNTDKALDLAEKLGKLVAVKTAEAVIFGYALIYKEKLQAFAIDFASDVSRHFQIDLAELAPFFETKFRDFQQELAEVPAPPWTEQDSDGASTFD